MTNNSDRRNFIKKAASVVGASSVIAGTQAESAPNNDRKLKIGAIGVGPSSFMSYCWSDIIESSKPGTRQGTIGTRLLNMEITHVWDTDRKAAEEFANRLSATVTNKFDDMIGEVDGVIVGNFDDVGFQHKLVIPFLKAGIPSYISRPFAYSLRDIDSVLDAAASTNTPIMATAKFEHYKEVQALQNKIKNVGKIRIVQVASYTTDFPIHFHIQFMMLKTLGYDVEQVSMLTNHDMRSNYVHLVYLYPEKEEQPPYICTIDGSRIPDQFHVRIIGDTGIEEASMLRGYDWEYSLLHRYAPQVIDMQRTFEGKNYEPYDIVRKKTEIFLTAYYSYLERGGAPVNVGTVPADWRVNSKNINTSSEPGQDTRK